MPIPNVLVIGGGPAGLATALFLAEKGIAATVLEKGDWPRDKVCGQGIMPCGVELLQSLGLRLNEMEGSVITGIEWRSDTGRTATLHLPDHRAIWGVRRQNLSAALHRLAATKKEITLRPRSRLVGLTRVAAGWSCAIRGERIERETFPCVVGADGLRSTTARLLEIKDRAFALPQRFGIRQHFQVRPWSHFVEVEWGRGHELYVTPSGDQTVAVAALCWPEYLPKGASRLVELVQRSPVLADRLRGAPAIDHAHVYGPLGTRRPQPREESALLIGDAFCFWDGITGEGIAMSLVQARLTAEHLALNGGANWRLLKARLAGTLQPYLLTTGLALRLSRTPVVRDAALRLFGAWPALLRTYIDLSGPRVIAR